MGVDAMWTRHITAVICVLLGVHTVGRTARGQRHSGRLAITLMFAFADVMMCFSQPDATPTHRRIRGLVQTCVPVRIVDAPNSVFIRAVVDSTLPDSATDGVLYCMQVRTELDSAVVPVVAVPGLVGTRIPVTVHSRLDSTVVLLPSVRVPIDLNAVYQLVLPIRSDTITIDSMLTCEPWNGRRGGVIELHATQVIIFDSGRVDVSARGHRGGRRSADGGSCSLTQACDPAQSGRTAEKGESIVVPQAQCVSGHTSWASGGGGGDAHNAGGGGGGNGGGGGRGGDQWSCGLPLGMHGMPGCAIRDTTFDRYVFGGGGGGGHQNNSVGTDGVAGGGIVVLHAPRIEGDTVHIVADGENNSRAAANDGAGGGGAGGTIVVDVCTIAAELQASLRGGRGGNCAGGHGPGGGGGGGRMLVEPSTLQRADSTLRVERSGGISGVNGGPGATFNARPGEPGIIVPLCARVSTHQVTSATELAIGDIDTLMLLSRDSSERCPVIITHTITIAGWSLLPLIDSMRFDPSVSVRVERRAADTTVIIVSLPSTSSTAIPLLGLLHQDTTSTVRQTTSVVFPDSIPSCTWPPDERVIVTRACGLPLRLVRRWTPLRVTAESFNGVIDVTVDGSTNTPTDIVVSTMQGRVVASGVCSSYERRSDQEWRGTIVIPSAHLAHGVYVVTVHSQQGIASTTLFLSR